MFVFTMYDWHHHNLLVSETGSSAGEESTCNISEITTRIPLIWVLCLYHIWDILSCTVTTSFLIYDKILSFSTFLWPHIWSPKELEGQHFHGQQFFLLTPFSFNSNFTFSTITFYFFTVLSSLPGNLLLNNPFL